MRFAVEQQALQNPLLYRPQEHPSTLQITAQVLPAGNGWSTVLFQEQALPLLILLPAWRLSVFNWLPAMEFAAPVKLHWHIQQTSAAMRNTSFKKPMALD